MRNLPRDMYLAIVIAAFSVVYLYLDFQLPNQASGDPIGPRLYPGLLGFGLLGAALLLIVETRSRRTLLTRVVPTVPQSKRNVGVLFGIAAWTLIYYSAFQTIGYLVSTVCFIFVLLLYFNPRHHITNAAVAIGFSALVYLLFTDFLAVDLPKGILPF
jgi:putative tricarboxylic transport membrane protein